MHASRILSCRVNTSKITHSYLSLDYIYVEINVQPNRNYVILIPVYARSVC